MMIYKFTYNEYVAKDGEKEKIIFEVKEKLENKLLLEVRLLHKETNQVTTYPKMVDIRLDFDEDSGSGEESVWFPKGNLVYASDYFNPYYPEKIENKAMFFADCPLSTCKGVGIARIFECLIDQLREKDSEPGDVLRTTFGRDRYLFERTEEGYKYLGCE